MSVQTSVDNLYNEYTNELNERKIQISEERWKQVLLFRRHLYTKVELQKSTFQHTLKKLSDSFFQHEKKRYLTFSNFLISLQENQYKLSVQVAKLIYNAFDVLQKNQFDWRTFVYMLHVTSRDVNEDIVSLIKLAYRFHVGYIQDLDEPCNSSVKFQHLGRVFGMIIRPDKVQLVLELFDEVWSSHETLSRINNGGKESTLVTYSNFTNILVAISELNVNLETTSLQNSFEQEYFPYTLYKYRRCMRYMAHFVTLTSMKTKFRCLLEWKRIAKLQRRMRLFFGKYIERREHMFMSMAYTRLWEQAIIQNAAISIQRVIRTFIAKATSFYLWTEKASTILIQKTIRSFIAKCRVRHIRWKRQSAALTIQRCIRGSIGRHIARNRLLTYIDVRHLYILQQKEIQHHNEVIRKAIIMQRMYRHKINVRKFKESVAKKSREMEVVKAIESLQLEEETEQRIHEERVKVHAQESLKQYESERYNEARAAAAKDKVRQLHIRLLDKERYEKQRKEFELELQAREESKQTLIKDLNKKESEVCKELEKRCLHCLHSPETPLERKEGKNIRQRIKKRYVRRLELYFTYQFAYISQNWIFE